MAITDIHAASDTARRGLGAFFASLGDRFADACIRAEQSHHRRLGFALVSADVLRDIRISAEEATGLSSRQPDLPFFMQTGFGCR
jgi:hypothetical protein